MTDVENLKLSPHCAIYAVLLQSNLFFVLFGKKGFVAIYTALLQNPFGQDLRTFTRRKIESVFMLMFYAEKNRKCFYLKL